MSKFRFDRKAQQFRTQKGVLLEKLANNAVNHFKVDVFDARSFDGRAWTPNKVSNGSQQLVKTGRMRQSINILRRTKNSITVGSEVPYAKYHNSGTENLPKRQFIGETKELKRENSVEIGLYLKRVGKRSKI